VARCVLAGPRMRATSSPAARAVFCALSFFLQSSFGLTLEEIRNASDLTPQKFASFFRDFEFRFRSEVQEPQVFLATESGDCDDYAILAAMILRERGYTPRLITVRMPNLVHVVCYIEETKSYLDYNNRNYFLRTVSCGNTLEEIAKKVAKASKLRWTSVSEFTYDAGVKRLVRTVVEGEAQSVASLSR
jgi:hypothetical protein